MSEGKKTIPFKKREYIPADNKILVMRDGKKTKTDGGLFIPDKAQDKQTFATVIAVADNLKDKYAVGDRVCWGGFYQMLIDGGDDMGIAVLRHPEEIMYKFTDKEGTRPETDEEWSERMEEEHAAERLASGRAGKLVLTDG